MVAAEGIDAHWRPGRHRRAGAHAGAARARPGRGGRGRRVRRRRRRRPARCRGGRAARGGDRVLGATFTPHCARVHPARLVRGLARAVERRGGRIHERTRRRCGACPGPRPARWTGRRHGAGRGRGPGHRGLDRRAARAARGTSCRSTRSWWPPSRCRASFWAGAGLAGGRDVLRPPPPDHLRAADRRRPARLRRAGRPVPRRLPDRARFDRDAGVFAGAARHAAGPVPRPARARRSRTPGAARSASPATGTPASGSTARPVWRGPAATSATVSARSNLAGRTLADLVLGRDTELTRLPWVGHRSPRWEPEPLRWLGVNAGPAGDDRGRRRGAPHRPPQPDRPSPGPPARPLATIMPTAARGPSLVVNDHAHAARAPPW